MAIKAGQILHYARSVEEAGPDGVGAGPGFLVDRIQSAGVTALNVNEERIEELGNYETVAVTRDIPDLTFEIESFDMETELQQILTGFDGTAAPGTELNLVGNIAPIDVVSPFKGSGVFTVVKGIIIPFLNLEALAYNFTLADPASVTATMRGDSIFYVPGSVFREVDTGTGAQTAFTFTNGPAYRSVIAGDEYFALGVTVDGKRQRLGSDYTNTSAGITFLVAPANGAKIVYLYGSGTAQAFAQADHPLAAVKPAAVKARNVKVRLGMGTNQVTAVDTGAATGGTFTLTVNGATTAAIADGATAAAVESAVEALPNVVNVTVVGSGTTAAPWDITFNDNFNAWAVTGDGALLVGGLLTIAELTAAAGGALVFGVQAADVSWRVTLERDEEFGNPIAVASDFDVPEVSGTMTLKSTDADALFDFIQRVAGITGTDIANATQDPPQLYLQMDLEHPDTGDVMQSLVIPEAQFVVPAIQGQVGQKLETDFPFTGDTLKIFVG